MEYRESAEDLDWVGFDLDGARRAISANAARVADLLRSTSEPDRQAYRCDWTIAETAAHLVVVARANLGYAQGRTEPVLELNQLAVTNQKRIDQLPERDLKRLADALEAAIEEFLSVTEAAGATDLRPWHSRTRLPLGGMSGMLLAELLLHGRDVARAQRRRWHLDQSDAVHVVRGGLAFCPLVIHHDLARERPITFRLRCRGVPTSIWVFCEGELTISPDQGQPVDLHLRVDPVTFMLLGFGRQSPLTAALLGRARTWGRKPLAAFRIPSYFVPG